MFIHFAKNSWISSRNKRFMVLLLTTSEKWYIVLTRTTTNFLYRTNVSNVLCLYALFRWYSCWWKGLLWRVFQFIYRYFTKETDGKESFEVLLQCAMFTAKPRYAELKLLHVYSFTFRRAAEFNFSLICIAVTDFIFCYLPRIHFSVLYHCPQTYLNYIVPSP